MQRKKLELLKLNREVLRNWNPDLLVGSIAQPELNVLSSEKGHSGLGPRSLRMGHELAIAGIPKEEQIRLILQMLEKPPNWIQLPPQGENAYVTVKKFAGVIFIRNTIRREILKTHTARKKPCVPPSALQSPSECPYQWMQLEKQHFDFQSPSSRILYAQGY